MSAVNSKSFRLLGTLCLLTAHACHPASTEPGSRGTRPNLIWIMADDLGYGDLGCYGQEVIQTPRLDRMAAEGMRFTQFYAGSTVCAPSRSVLMTGQHMGHTFVRGNAGGDLSIQTLREKDRTVAQLLKQAGYATALVGKWGLGELGSSGHPLKKGFDYFFGYLNQVHAHNYYPEFLWRNEEKVPLRNKVVSVGDGYAGFLGGYAIERIDYSHDLLVEDALGWIRDQPQSPFFLYLALTIPHANNEGTRGTGDGQEVPDYGRYATEEWPDPDKGQAAMISRMDHDVGRLLDLLGQLGISDHTLVFFTSDNGHHREGGNNPEFFNSNGPLRGRKRDLYEGGIRVPMIAWGPGTVSPGGVSDHIGYFGDLMATAAELAGIPAPGDIDSLSLLPALKGRSSQQQHDYLYWEFYEGQGGAQAVRMGPWKGVRRPAFTGAIELYNLDHDLAEERDVAVDHPEVVLRIRAAMEEAHLPSPNWGIR